MCAQTVMVFRDIENNRDTYNDLLFALQEVLGARGHTGAPKVYVNDLRTASELLGPCLQPDNDSPHWLPSQWRAFVLHLLVRLPCVKEELKKQEDLQAQAERNLQEMLAHAKDPANRLRVLTGRPQRPPRHREAARVQGARGQIASA